MVKRAVEGRAKSIDDQWEKKIPRSKSELNNKEVVITSSYQMKFKI